MRDKARPAKGLMQILYILLVISFLALVWAAISITRHIRRSAAVQAHSKAEPEQISTTIASHPSRRDPIASRSHSDWANLEKSIGKHDLGNTDYPQAANRTRTAPTKP